MPARADQTAAAAWAEALGAWAIPQAILDAAPERPWRFPPAVFAWTPERAATEKRLMTTSRLRAMEALPESGSVLDVGIGGGRASLPLVPPAAFITGVDSSAELLDAFEEAAQREGVAHRTVPGTWPDVAGQVDVHDVVVCHHVAYNVADLVPFAQALTDHARRRVVLELTAEHPMTNLNEAWKVLHGLPRPSRPTARDAVAVLQEAGFAVIAEPNERRVAASQSRAEVVAFARRRLCVGADRDAEIDRLLGPDVQSPLRQVVTVWWDREAQA